MNKRFFAIIGLIIASQLYGMDKTDKGLYPHDYECKRNWFFEGEHKFNGKFPLRIARDNILRNLCDSREYGAFDLNEPELRAFYQFVDGKAPIVSARRSFYETIDTELGSLSQQLKQSLVQLRKKLGRPVRKGNVVPAKDNIHWQNLNTQLANPPTGEITWWENIINEIPNFSQPLEKIALTSNLIGSKQSHYFKKELVKAVALCVDGVFRAQTTVHDEEIETKNAEINNERAAKNQELAAKEAAQRDYTAAHNNFVAERLVRNQLQLDFNAENTAKTALQTQLTAQQQTAETNAAELRRLEPNKDAYFRTLRQKLGEAVYASHQQQIPLEPSSVQALAERRTNPPAVHLAIYGRELLAPALYPLYNLVIKTAQVSPQNAMALLVSVMGNLHFGISDTYAQLLHKLRSDVAKLTDEKAALMTHFESSIRDVTQQKNQIDTHARDAFKVLQKDLSPLQRELPTLRDRVRDQDIEIRALRAALAPHNQQ